MPLFAFAIWETRTVAGRNVTFPARQPAQLRPISDTAAQARIRDLVLEAYTLYEEELTRTA